MPEARHAQPLQGVDEMFRSPDNSHAVDEMFHSFEALKRDAIGLLHTGPRMLELRLRGAPSIQAVAHPSIQVVAEAPSTVAPVHSERALFE